MNTKGNNVNTVAERITDAVLSETYMTKENVLHRTRSILRAWVTSNDRPLNYDNIKTEAGHLQRRLESKIIELKFWHDIAAQKVDEKQMKKYYSELDEILLAEGYRTE